MRSSYDVVIIGGGAHGLATAYYLAKNHGITNIAVIEQKFIGYGGSGRNTAILRSNYRTEEGILFYDQSLKLYEDLAQELDYNLMFSQQGHFTLGHSTASMPALDQGSLQPGGGGQPYDSGSSRNQEDASGNRYFQSPPVPDHGSALPSSGRDHPA